jgi:IS30 family transposase
MGRGRRPNYTEEQFNQVWQLRKEGYKSWDISQMLQVNPGSIHIILHNHGGIAPRTKKPRESHLSMEDRESISRGLASGFSMRAIAAAMGRPVSTISREVARNGGRTSYRATRAHDRAQDCMKRPKPYLLDTHEQLRQHVLEKLRLNWSPEQIAGELPMSYPNDETMRISLETIYKMIYVQARGALKKELCAHLRRKRRLRRSRSLGNKSPKQGQILDSVSIRERPDEVNDRAIPGHWEGDLLLGTTSTQVATLVERTSRFLMLIRLESKQASYVSEAISKHVETLPAQLKKSLTWDRGSEFADHKHFTIASGVPVYFCDPQSPWQRGSNENTNGLLRQYLPRGQNFSVYTQEDLDGIAQELNTRPRKTLGFRTPAVVLEEVLR